MGISIEGNHESGFAVHNDETGDLLFATESATRLIDWLVTRYGGNARWIATAGEAARLIAESQKSKISAIKVVRHITGAGLKEGKDAVERHLPNLTAKQEN